MRAAQNTIGNLVLASALSLTATPSLAGEADAKQILRNMSDYIASLETFSFSYDSTLEVVTTDHQKIGLAASGDVSVKRPDRLHATRTGGFSDLEMAYDGTQLLLLGKDAGVYTTLDAPETIDALIDELRDTYGRPVPAADLITQDAYEVLMTDVKDVKDMGSGVVGGRVCDHLAFRTDEVDWQIWVAAGDAPFPCRFTITTKSLAQGPQYRVDVREWRAEADLPASLFAPEIPDGLQEVSLETSPEAFRDLPEHFLIGDDR